MTREIVCRYDIYSLGNFVLCFCQKRDILQKLLSCFVSAYSIQYVSMYCSIE